MNQSRLSTAKVTKKVLFQVDEKFVSYASFMEKMELYKESVFCDYWIRDSCTLKKHNKKFPDGFATKADPKLEYYYVRFACVKGGRVCTHKNTVRKTSSIREHCDAGIFLRLSSDARYLEIKQLCEDHSHPVSEELFRALPQRRLKIPQKLKETAWQLLHASESKKIVRKKIFEESGCWVTSKDLQNLKSRTYPKINVKSDSLENYKNNLTDIAFEHLKKQFDLISSVKLIGILNSEAGVVKSSEGLLKVTPMTCECQFHINMSLPCRHILKFRGECNQPLFDETLCSERWTRSYNSISSEDASYESVDMSNEFEIKESKNERIKRKMETLTDQQKHKLMNKECIKLSKTCSKVNSNIFFERIKFIRKLCKYWSKVEDLQNSEVKTMEASNFEVTVIQPPVCVLLEETTNSEDFLREYNNNMLLEETVMDTSLAYPVKEFAYSCDKSVDPFNPERSHNKILTFSPVKISNKKFRDCSEELSKTVVGFKRKRKQKNEDPQNCHKYNNNMLLEETVMDTSLAYPVEEFPYSCDKLIDDFNPDHSHNKILTLSPNKILNEKFGDCTKGLIKTVVGFKRKRKQKNEDPQNCHKLVNFQNVWKNELT